MSYRNLSKAAFILLTLFILSPGCASKWTWKTEPSALSLQWPFQPESPKIKFLRLFQGFERSGSKSFLRTVAGTADEENGSFFLPVAVATGKDGRIAVADMGRRCVYLFLPAEQRYICLSSAGKQQISSPVGVVFDAQLRLYVSDSTGKVIAFGHDGSFLFTIEKAGDESFQRPTGLAYSPGKNLLFVVDTLANQVHALKPNGESVFSFGQRGEKPGSFNYPTHIFRSEKGILYVTDSLNFRIAMFDESGALLHSFGHHGDGSGDLAMPKGVAADQDGIVYVVDSIFDNVQLFSDRGEFLLTIGKRGNDFGEFWLPSGIFIDANTLYVCDTYNRRIQIFQVMERYGHDES